MGYYDFPEELMASLMKNACVEELFYLRDLSQRKLFLNDIIDQQTVEDAVRHIMQFNKEDQQIPVEDRKPIILYLTSNGGCVDSGFKLIDAIKLSKTPVYTVNDGWQYSMGFLIGIAGHKRFAFPDAKFLMHDGTSYIINSTMKAMDQVVFQNKVDEKIKDYVLSNTKITPEIYDSKNRIEWYMFAEDAKDMGVVDYIIGVDCDIDEVI